MSSQFTDVTGTKVGERLSFSCPRCGEAHSWSLNQLVSIRDQAIADHCRKCGQGFRVLNPYTSRKVGATGAPSPSSAATYPTNEQAAELSSQPVVTTRQSQVQHRSNPAVAYQYKVVPFIGQNKGSLSASDVANQLENVIQQHTSEGWEFCQLTDVNVEVQPGCIAGLLGAHTQYVRFDQLIFRR